MSNNAYELLALAARYLFTLLMLIIVLRAWKITIVDNRRARKLRQLSPETGLSGELVVLEGGEKARSGMRYPVIREGMIGSSRKADIRIRHSSIRRIHAYFELTGDGLRLRAHGDAMMSESWGDPARRLLLRDGDTVEFGNVQLMLVLTDARGGSSIAAPERYPEDDDGFFGTERSGSAPRRERSSSRRPEPPRGYDDPDEDEELPPIRSADDDLFSTPRRSRPKDDWSNPLVRPDRAQSGARTPSSSRDDSLFSAREFPDDTGDADDDIFSTRPRTRHRVESPIPAEGARRRRKNASSDTNDEDLWL